MSEKQYDLITYGRSSIDLYSANIGADFVNIKQFNAYVGGSPLNIAVGAKRLGLKSALLTGIGQDQIGDFLLKFLVEEGVETKFIPRKPGFRTSAVVLGIQPPDNFPLVYYRENCADSKVTIDDVIAANIGSFRMFEISATALNVEPSRSAGFFAAEEAVKQGLGINAGHDLNLDNLNFFNKNIPGLLEVSIGHALVCDALYLGLENTIQSYLRELKNY